jgi:hypothetical protein
MTGRLNRYSKIGAISLAGTASGCMRWLGGTAPEARADLPAMVTIAGVPWDGRRGRSCPALTGVMTVGCVPRDGARGRCPRLRSHHDGGPDAFLQMAHEGLPGDGLSRQWMRALRPHSHARFARVGGRAASITGLNRALMVNPMGRSCPPNAGVQPRRHR